MAGAHDDPGWVARMGAARHTRARGLRAGAVGFRPRHRSSETAQEGATRTATPGLILAGAFVVVLVVVLVGSVELDEKGVRGTVIGAGLGLLNLGLGCLVMRRALRRGMKQALMTVVAGMIARLLVVAGLMVLFQRTGAADPTAFALSFLVFFFVYLGLEVLLVERSLD